MEALLFEFCFDYHPQAETGNTSNMLCSYDIRDRQDISIQIAHSIAAAIHNISRDLTRAILTPKGLVLSNFDRILLLSDNPETSSNRSLAQQAC